MNRIILRFDAEYKTYHPAAALWQVLSQFHGLILHKQSDGTYSREGKNDQIELKNLPKQIYMAFLTREEYERNKR